MERKLREGHLSFSKGQTAFLLIVAGHLWLLIKGLNKAQGSLQFPEEYSHTTVLQEQFRFYGLIIKSLNVVLYH